MQQQFEANAARPLFTGVAVRHLCILFVSIISEVNYISKKGLKPFRMFIHPARSLKETSSLNMGLNTCYRWVQLEKCSR